MHSNFQLMPYPWFNNTQAPLYPLLKFPEPFPGVTTNRNDEGNSQLIMKFIQLNYNIVTESATKYNNDGGPGGLYIDMQSIPEVEIESAGQWRGLTLVPWGVNYRIEPGINQFTNQLKDSNNNNPINNLLAIAKYHRGSVWASNLIENDINTFKNIKKFYSHFHPGTWEWGARALVNDGKYQLALFLLTFAIDFQTNANDLGIAALPIVIDRLYTSSILLEELQSYINVISNYLSKYKYAIAGPIGINANINDIKNQKPITINPKDLHKNLAVSWLRFIGVLKICIQVKAQFEEAIISTKQQLNGLDYINDDFIINILQDDVIDDLISRGKNAINSFIIEYKDDNDVITFKNAIQKW